MRNRIIVLLSLTLLLTISAFAQDAMPTKEETVNYINKRLQELRGSAFDIGPSGSLPKITYRYISLSFKLNGDIVDLITDAQNEVPYKLPPTGTRCSFNPKYISSGLDAVTIDKSTTPGSTSGAISVKLVDKLAKYESKDLKLDMAGCSVPFDPKIPDQGSRLVKALLHLRDLVKAEEDPFAK
jgi:hypothetical protein